MEKKILSFYLVKEDFNDFICSYFGTDNSNENMIKLLNFLKEFKNMNILQLLENKMIVNGITLPFHEKEEYLEFLKNSIKNDPNFRWRIGLEIESHTEENYNGRDYDVYYSNIIVHYTRTETNEEYEKRINKLEKEKLEKKQRKEREEKYQYDFYLELKKKYEGGK